MSKEETKRVRFKSGKFGNAVMTINASDFNPAIHEDASTKPAAKKASTKPAAK